MEAIGSVVGILGAFTAVTVFFAFITGVVAASRLAPALWWSEHPWGSLWIMMPVMMAGAVLAGVGASTSGMIIVLTALVGIYASAIWGLRVTWYRSRRRAALIFVIVMALVGATGISRWLERGRDSRELDQAVLTVMICAVSWIVAVFVADYVYLRMAARRPPASPAEVHAS